MTEIFTARTVEDAKNAAVKKFGVSIEKIKFDIIEEGKKGLFGIGRIDASVKAEYTPEPAKKPEKSVKTPRTEIKASEKKTEKPVAEKKVKPETLNDVVEQKPDLFKESDVIDIEFSDDSPITVTEEYTEKTKAAIAYISRIISAMGIDATYKVRQNAAGALIEIESNNNGIIIGRRGDTLDSIQYLASMIVNKGDKDYYRITLDCYDYRAKRKETLQQLAEKVAKSVLRTGRSQPLEPMNPYERRVIHAAISGIEGVSSRSVGEEPFRKIIISSLNSKRNGSNDRRRSSSQGGGVRNYRDNNSNDRNLRPRQPREHKEIDLSTSFEKDYKRPKPEDNIEGGLYGKINF